jgi:RimJ/RimL family protein N-acetyltransferase
MNLHRVDLRVLAFNDGAIASYRKCGFVQEGCERESCWHLYEHLGFEPIGVSGRKVHLRRTHS